MDTLVAQSKNVGTPSTDSKKNFRFSVQKRLSGPLYVEALLAKARKSQIVENWIGLVRTRLIAHRGEKPTTKASQRQRL